MGKIELRLQELGIDLPEPPKAVANYVPCVQTGNLLFVSGQVSANLKGKAGADVDPELAYEGARQCAISLLAQAQAALGDLDRITRVVRLGGFVNCGPDFTAIPQVINGASDLMVEVFGDAGRHARAAVGAPSLPMGVTVEVDAVFQID
jgi:enamine deaminase RidA (YjgF/YER057c/UK114 family)